MHCSLQCPLHWHFHTRTIQLCGLVRKKHEDELYDSDSRV